MKRRFNPLIGTTARIRDLGTVQGDAVSASVASIDAKRICLHCTTAIAPSTPARIDIDGALVLGEVVGYDESSRLVIVDIDQVIPSLTELNSLVHAVLGGRQQSVSPANEGQTDRRMDHLHAGRQDYYPL